MSAQHRSGQIDHLFLNSNMSIHNLSIRLLLTPLLVLITYVFFNPQTATAASYELVWSDTFSNGIDYSKWTKGFQWGRTNQNQPNTYYPYSNVKVSQGNLQIIAKGADFNANGRTYNWQGAAINTWNKFHIGKGSRFRARIRLPNRSGVNPGFWLLPKNTEWPPEIDIVEFPGARNENGRKIYIGAWNGTRSNPNKVVDATYTHSSDLSAGFHTYELRRWSNALGWYFDGVQILYSNATSPGNEMYINFSMSVNDDGGSWWGTPPNNNNWEYYMKVDWLEVYRQTP